MQPSNATLSVTFTVSGFQGVSCVLTGSKRGGIVFKWVCTAARTARQPLLLLFANGERLTSSQTGSKATELSLLSKQRFHTAGASRSDLCDNVQSCLALTTYVLWLLLDKRRNGTNA